MSWPFNQKAMDKQASIAAQMHAQVRQRQEQLANVARLLDSLDEITASVDCLGDL